MGECRSSNTVLIKHEYLKCVTHSKPDHVVSMLQCQLKAMRGLEMEIQAKDAELTRLKDKLARAEKLKTALMEIRAETSQWLTVKADVAKIDAIAARALEAYDRRGDQQK